MTADKVTLRVNLVVTYQVTDPVKAVTVTSDHAQALYRQAQLALRAAVGARPLDDLLADKDTVGREMREALAERTGTGSARGGVWGGFRAARASPGIEKNYCPPHGFPV